MQDSPVAKHISEVKKGDTFLIDGKHITATSDAYLTKSDNGKEWNFESGDDYYYARDFECGIVDNTDTPRHENKPPPKDLFLLYHCNEWCEKSKASLALATSDKNTLYAAIAGEILTGNMEYLGGSGGNGFAAFKKDNLDGEDVLKELKYGFVTEMREALLSEPETLPEYCTVASEFLAADFQFDAAEFDAAYNSANDCEADPDNENEDDMEI